MSPRGDSIASRSLTAGVNLTEVGLGTAQLGNLYRATSADEVVSTISTAWDAGIRYFDTAPHYGLGLAETRLGEQLAGRQREHFVISTKVGKLLVPTPHNSHQRDDEGFDVPADYRRQFDFSRDGILRSLESSLTRLGLDRVDIVYLHDPEHHFEQASTEGVSALIELRDQGVVGAIGAGMNYAPPLAELIRRADIDVVMCAGRFTLLDAEALDDLLPLATSRGVGVVVAGVYNSGILASETPPSSASFDYLPASDDIIRRARDIAAVCAAHSVTLPEAALGYVLRHPSVVSVVVGARGRAQVDQTIDRYRSRIPNELWSDLADRGLTRNFDVDERPTS